jgi:tetratricopeptide (TPR) repeat protein
MGIVTNSVTSPESSSELCAMAEHLGLEGKNKEALRLVNLAIRKNPGNQNAYKLKGYSLLGLNRLGAALAAFRKCLSLAPQRLYYHYYLGKTYSVMKKFRFAIEEYRKAIDSAWPYKNKRFSNAIVYRQMGLTYVLWRKPGEALWCYEKALSMGDYFGAPLRKSAMALKKSRVQAKAPTGF